MKGQLMSAIGSKVDTLAYGVGGMAGVGVVENVTTAEALQITIQVLIGLVTLWKLVIKKDKNG